MADPLSNNVGLALPTRGSDVGTWDVPMNGNGNAIDGMFGGVQSFSLTNANVTLTLPAGFTPTPGAGPTQAQNSLLKFSGTLTGNCVITCTRPGYFICYNACTVGSFYVSLWNGSGNVIGLPPGRLQHVFNDGTNYYYVNLPEIGSFVDMAGITAVPAWIGAATVPPYLYCDGSVYNVATYPFLGAILGSTFGGNGSTTFGVPDHRNRFRAPFGTGGGQFITNSGSGIHGETVGSFGGNELMASHNHGVTDNGHSHFAEDNASATRYVGDSNNVVSFAPGNNPGVTALASAAANSLKSIATSTNGTGISIQNAGGGSSGNMPPTLIFGISLIRSG